MHINEDHFIAEIIDPDTGEVLPEGPLEIKASATFSDSMTKGLKAFAEICPEAEKGRVVYSGETMSAAVNFTDTDAWCI